MKKHSIAKNYIYNLAYQLLTLVLPVITVPYVSRVLGAESIGIYSYTIAITTYFITFGSLGIALYGQREIAFRQNKKEEYSKTFYEIAILRLMTLLLSLIVYGSIFVLGGNQYNTYYAILLLEIVGNIFDISWFFQGLEEFKKTVIRNIIIKLLSVLATFIFVRTQDDLCIYFAIYVASVLFGNISLWFYLPKFLTKIKIKTLNIKKHIKPTIALFIPQIAIQIYTLLDKVMIGLLIIDKSEVGYYDQSQKIIRILLTIITSFGTVMMPRIAFTFSQGNKQKIREYIGKSFGLVSLLAVPMIIGLMAFSDVFVPWFFGDGYDRVSLLMKIISPILLFIGLSNVTGTQYLLPTKRQKEFTTSVIVGACANFVLNMALIPQYGALGASIGTVVAEGVVTLAQMLLVRKELDIINYFKGMFANVVAGVFMMATTYALKIIIPNSIVSVAGCVMAGTVVYIIALYLLREELLRQCLRKFFKSKKRTS